MGLIARVMLGTIKVYQRVLSPLLGQNCRYQPTCSAYAMTAIERYGSMAGGLMALRRISRCHPWGGHGYDPVPEKHNE